MCVLKTCCHFQVLSQEVDDIKSANILLDKNFELEIADQVFVYQPLMHLGQLCASSKAKERPEMIKVYISYVFGIAYSPGFLYSLWCFNQTESVCSSCVNINNSFFYQVEVYQATHKEHILRVYFFVLRRLRRGTVLLDKLEEREGSIRIPHS